MKIIIPSNILRDGLNKILSVVDRKNSRPILTNCLIETENNQINLVATDLEVSSKIILEANVESQGSFCINSKSFFDILRELPDDLINLEIDSSKNLLNLNCKNISYSLLVTNSEEYPKLTFENSQNTFEVTSSQVSDIISKTSHAVSHDETRLFLNGIYLQQMENNLRAVAIDGHRLALLDLENIHSDNKNLADGIIVPKKGINELRKVSEAYPNSTLKISVDDSFMYINAEDKYFLSVRLIARDYPKYQTVIPAKTQHTMNIDRDILLNSIKRIKLLSNEKTNGIKLVLTRNQLTLAAKHPSLGHATETIGVDFVGEEMEIGFNAKYLIESLSVLNIGEVVFEFNNELTPVIVKSEDMPNYLGIVMPLKL
jgi:DNA polymerase-3 subunit beta